MMEISTRAAQAVMLSFFAIFMVGALGLGLPPRAQINSVYPTEGSCFGGTYLVIDGSGFSFPTWANPWDAQAVFVGTVPCKIVPHYTHASRIVCITGEATPFTDQNNLAVSVQIFSGLGGAQTVVRTNAFSYKRSNTPFLSWSREWAGTGGDVMKFQAEVDRSINSAHFLEINIGHEAMCTIDEETYPLTTVSGNMWDDSKLVRCTIPDSEFLLPGHYNISMRHNALDKDEGSCPNAACFPEDYSDFDSGKGYGRGEVVHEFDEDYGRVRWNWAGTVDLSTGRAHHFTVYPAVDSVLPTRGGVYGGNQLTIQGKSFSPDPSENEVTVGGVPCTVSEATHNELKCTLGASINATLQGYSTPRGLRAEAFRWYGSSLSGAPTSLSSPAVTPIETKLLFDKIDFVSLNDYLEDARSNLDDFVRDSMGYFIAPLTTNYTFYVAGNDIVELYISNDTSLDNLALQCKNSYWTRFDHYWGRNQRNHPAAWWYRTDKLLGPFSGSSTQVSEPVSLQAGEKYAFRILHLDYGSTDFTRVAMKVGSISTATNASGVPHDDETVAAILGGHPAMELQMIRMKVTAQREQVSITIHNVNQTGGFRLRVANEAGLEGLILFSSFDVNHEDMKEAIVDATYVDTVTGDEYDIISGCNKNSVSSWSSQNGVERQIVLQFNCALKDAATRWVYNIEATNIMLGPTTDVSVGHLQNASEAVGGTFRVGFDGMWSENIYARGGSRDYMARQIQNIRREGDDGVEIEAWPCMDCWRSPEYWEMYIRFREPRGNVPQVELDTSLVTGEVVEFFVTTIEEGDSDAAFLERIPADFFEQPPTRSVREPCNAEYGVDYTVTTGYFLGSDILLSGGSVGVRGCAALCDYNLACVAFSVHRETGDCSLYNEAGAASGENSTTDDSFSTCGGAAQCAVVGNATVNDTECIAMTTGLDGYIYTPCNGAVANCSCCKRESTSENRVPIRVVSRGVNGGTTEAELPSFSFSQVISPLLLDVAPTTVSYGTEVSFSVAGLLSTEDVLVALGERVACENITLSEADVNFSLASVTHGLESGDAVLTPIVLVDIFTCIVTDGIAGEHDVVMVSNTQGMADPSTLGTVLYEPSIASLTPSSGSMVGGTLIVMEGDGLVGLPCSMIMVSGMPCAEPSTMGIYVSSNASTSTLSCLTPAYSGYDADAAWDASREEMVDVTISVPASMAATVRAQFTFKASETPTVSAVSPAEMSAAISAFVYFNGSNFTAASSTDDDETPKIRIGSRFCKFSEDDFADDFLKCWFPRASAGVPVDPAHNVTLWFPAWGFARAVTDVTLVSEFEVQSVSPRTGSHAGGTILTLTGRGFHPFDESKNEVTLLLSDGSQRACTILSGSYTGVTCQLQGGTPALDPTAGRRLVDVETRSEELCKGPGADHAKGHCFAREIMQRGGLKRHHQADLAHFDRTVGHLAYNHPADQQFEESHCEEDANGMFSCAMPEAASNSNSISSSSVSSPPLATGPALPMAMLRRLAEIVEPSSGPMVSNGPSAGPPSSGPEDEEVEAPLVLDLSGNIRFRIAGVTARCVEESNCSFSYLVNSTYQVMQVTPLNGSFADAPNVTVTITPPISDVSMVTVSFGETNCPVASSYDAAWEGENATVLVVPLCAFKASTVPVYVFVDPLGYAVDASPQTGSEFYFVQELQLHSISPATGAFCGGTEVTVTGAGFSPVEEENLVSVGWKACEVTSSSLTELHCYSPSSRGVSSLVQALQVAVSDSGAGRSTGFRAEYYPGSQSGTFMDPFAASDTPPAIVRTDATINFASDADMPYTSSFQARWTAWLYIEEAGVYTFTLESDDGSVLYISDELVVNNGGFHGTEIRSNAQYMSSGRHLVTVQFFEGSGDARMVFSYSGPDTGYVQDVVPASRVEPTSFAIAGFIDEQLPYFNFTYLEEASSPQIANISVSNGELEVTGSNFGASAGLVALGTASKPDENFQCAVVSWSDTSITCTLPSQWPAGEWSVRVWTDALGWACPFHTTILALANVTAVEMHGISTAVVVGDRWVPILKSDGSDVWGFDAALWEDNSTLAETFAFDQPDNVKYEAFLTVPFRRIRMCVGSPDQNCIEHFFATEWMSAKELFSAGEIRDLSVHQQAILRSFGAQKGEYRECPMQEPGFNVQCGGNKARWGYCANCANQDCQAHGEDADATIGLGLKDENDNYVGAGWTYMFNSGVDSASCTGTPSEQAVWVWVENLANSSDLPELELGFGGGLELTLVGSGLGQSATGTLITVCGSTCNVTAADGENVTCVVPPLATDELLDAFPLAFPVDELARSEHVTRFYTDQGESESVISEAAYTSPVDEPVMLWNTRSSCWFAFELDARKVARVDSVAFFPPTNPVRRNMVRDSVFEVMNLSTGSWVQIMSLEEAEVTGESIQQGWNSFVLNETVYAQAFRIRLLPDACSSTSYGRDLMRGVRFYGNVVNADPSGKCDLEVSHISHPLASAPGRGFFIPATISYSLDRTPVVENLTPNRGTARGGTSVSLMGNTLMPVDAAGADAVDDVSSDFVVNFNGYPCVGESVNDTVGTCLTAERFAINAPSTSVWVKGKGFALLGGNTSERTTFRYIDKWSDPFSWLDSELPVEGDSVIVPEGQAILLDQDTPVLFFVMISGWMEFDRKDLHFQATYLWVAGGQLSIGSEEEPFLHQATITMHGDRWYTIELPFIGNKMVAVTNLGGLHGGCHVKTTNSVGRSASPCPVRSVGKLDLHGRPDTAWTRIIETAPAGAVNLSLAEPVAWLPGSEVVITPSERRDRVEERRFVKAIHDDGLTLELDSPLAKEHLGIWYYHDAVEPIDLRAAVGLMTKNIKIKGDDGSLLPGNSYLYGTHVGAFFGGQMRIENTEFTQTGQAANFGRYSSHWHVLGVGRNADVVDTAYLRNNSYHDTFQRAVVVHSTDFAVVRDNVAVRTHGHSFFTETGDEDFALFEHNLAVHPLPHHLLLDDDQQPAGFWLPGFMGWHRNNMAAGCVRGWRLRKLSHVAEGSSKLIFYNNSAHASGHGWHLKPPHMPATLQNFRTFTAFRCGMGMFYYQTGNIFHDDHKFVECGTGFHMNHLGNNVNTPPFFHDLVVVGNIDNNDPTSHTGLALSGPKDNEYWFTSGATIINMYNSAAFRHCWETACTARYERLKWYNSNRRTYSDWGLSGIFHDLDGTLTGYTNGFVSWDAPFLHFPECEVVDEHVGGIVCGKEDGTLRLRKNYVHDQEPWQLDGKNINVTTEAGTGFVPFDWKKLYGWAVPTVSGYTYDMRIDDPNDFQYLSLKWSEAPYVLTEWGYVPDEFHHREIYMDRNYTHYTPTNETAKIHLNYSDWRDHFDGRLSSPYGTVLTEEPEFSDPFGSFAIKLWKDQCDLYNLTENASLVCNGNYTDGFGIEVKDVLDTQPELPQVNGRLTYVVTTKVTDNFNVLPDTPWSLLQSFTARECPDSGCPTPQPGVGLEGNCRWWSDESGWPEGVLPADMDNTEIAADDCVVLDIETPTLHWLTILGSLKFSRSHNATLNAYSVKVWGYMEVGTPENPIPADVTATVALWGPETAHTVIMIDGLFLVNKVISVLGTLSAAGAPVDLQPWTRLVSTADIGTTSITVHGNCSQWPVGKTLGIASTEYPSPPETTETEVRTIVDVTYDPVLDQTTIEVDEPLEARHFAGVVMDEDDHGHWNSVVLKAPVSLLGGRSNVVFKTGEDSTYHGGYINIGGSPDGVWIGSANISNVDMERLGKHLYQQPALKFNYLGSSGQNLPLDKRSRIVDSVFSFSQAGAVELNGASYVEILNNVFHRTYRTAVWVTKTCQEYTISLRGNMAMETLRHPYESTSWVRPFASYLIENRPLALYGNVAAGSADSGFVLRPQMQARCDSNQGLPMLAQDEVNEAVGCLTGLFILRASASPRACLRVHGFRIWKSAHIGITTADQGASMRLDTMVVADNHIGISLGFLGSFGQMSHRVYMHNMTIFGSTPASVCGSSEQCRAITGDTPVGVTGSTCGSVMGTGWRRAGLITHVINTMGKLCEANPKLRVCRPPTTPVKLCVMPWESRIGTLGARYAETHMSAITFGYFKGNDCGMKSAAFTTHPSNPDFNFPYFFEDVKWLNDTMDDAGRFDLSQISNRDSYTQLMIVDRDGTLLETGAKDGSVVPLTNPALAVDSCIGKPNYYHCHLLKLRLLTWEPVGSPPERVLGSMKLWREGDGRATWSQGPVKAQCLPDDPPPLRAWAIQPDMNYNMTLFASSPKHHRIYYYNDDVEPIRVALHLSQPFRIEVYKDGVLLDESTYDTSQCCGDPRYPTREDPHGSYAFDPHQRRVYFTMWGGTHGGVPSSRGGGHLFLRAMQVVQLSLTMSVGLLEFDGDSVINNIATLLQIPASRIRIVSVQSNAQVEAQGGRRLVKRWINPQLVTNGRRLTADDVNATEDSNSTELTVQIIEENPDPVDESLLAGGYDSEDAAAFNLTVASEDDEDLDDGNYTDDDNSTANVSTSIQTEFNADAAAELSALAETIQTLAASGEMGEALGVEVEVTEVTSTDIETTDATATTSTTTTSTSTATSSSTSESTSSSTSTSDSSSSTGSSRNSQTSTSSTSTSVSESSSSTSSSSSSTTASSVSSTSSSSHSSTSTESTSSSGSSAASLTSTTSSSTSESSTTSASSETSTSSSSASTSTSESSASTWSSTTSTSVSTDSTQSSTSSTSSQSTAFTATSSTSTSTTRFTATSSTSSSTTVSDVAKTTTVSSTSTSSSRSSPTTSSTSASSVSSTSSLSTASSVSSQSSGSSTSTLTSGSTESTGSSHSSTSTSSSGSTAFSATSTTSTSTPNTVSTASSLSSSSTSTDTSETMTTSSSSTSTSTATGAAFVSRLSGTMTLSVSDASTIVGNGNAMTAIAQGIADGIPGVTADMVTVESITQVRRLSAETRELTAAVSIEVVYRIDLPVASGSAAAVTPADVTAAATSIQTGIETALANAGVSTTVQGITVSEPTVTVIAATTTTEPQAPVPTPTPTSTPTPTTPTITEQVTQVPSSGSSDDNFGPIVAVVVAVCLILMCMCAGGVFLWKASRRHTRREESFSLVDAFVGTAPSDASPMSRMRSEDEQSPANMRQVAQESDTSRSPTVKSPKRSSKMGGGIVSGFGPSLSADTRPRIPGGISPSSDC